jgi:hypothetical protein
VGPTDEISRGLNERAQVRAWNENIEIDRVDAIFIVTLFCHVLVTSHDGHLPSCAPFCFLLIHPPFTSIHCMHHLIKAPGCAASLHRRTVATSHLARQIARYMNGYTGVGKDEDEIMEAERN